MRLNNGIYGQRQGGTNQMVRIKFPGGAITPEQFDIMAHLCETYSRGWGHITTRQNIQMHYVELTQVPEVMRQIGAVGLTTREACGDTVRNVMACHLAGACPHEQLDVTAWAEAAFQHFVRNPLGQRLPRKFKINFSGCNTDCGQAMFNDVGVIATTRIREDGVERGRVPGVHRRRARGQPASRAGVGGVHRSRGSAADDRGAAARVRSDRQPRQQAAGTHEVGRRRTRDRRAASPGDQGPAHVAGIVVVAGWHPRRGGQDGRRPCRHVDHRVRDAGRSGCQRGAHTSRSVRTLGGHQRHPWSCQRLGLRSRLRSARRHHRRPVPLARQHPARARLGRPPEQPPERRVPRPHRGAAAATLPSARGDRDGPTRRRAARATWSPARAPTPATSRSRNRVDWPRPSASGWRRKAWRRSAESASTSPAARTAAASTTSPTSGSSEPSVGRTASPPPDTRCCSAATSARSRSTSATRRCACRPRTRRRQQHG